LEKAGITGRLLHLHDHSKASSFEDDGYKATFSDLLYDTFTNVTSASWHHQINRLKTSSPPAEVMWATWLIAVHLFHASSITRINATTALSSLLQANRLIGLRALPSVLYAIQAWAEPDLRAQLLSSLPAFGRHQLGAQMVQGIIRRLHSLPPTADKRLLAVMASTSLRLATRLFSINTRTLSRLSPMLVEEGQGLNDEVDEVRLARAQAMVEVIMEDPEAGADYVGSLQRYLKDDIAAIVSVAVDGITYLCTADCLDYIAAIRILAKKGRVNHINHPLVMMGLAELYGAATDIFDLSPEVEEGKEAEHIGDEEELRPRLPEKIFRTVVDNLWTLTNHEDSRVRSKAFAGLSGYVPVLLVSDDLQACQALRERLLQALLTEQDKHARKGLAEAVGVVLFIESEDAATWSTAMKLGMATTTATTAKPSRKALKNMPTREELVGLYHQGKSAGLASALMLSFQGGDVKGLTEALMDGLSDEDSGGRCYIQRLIAPIGFFRLIPELLKAMMVDYVSKRKDDFEATVVAVEAIETMIAQEMARERGDGMTAPCYLALAALASCLPLQLFHKAGEYLTTLLEILETAAVSIAVDVPTLLISISLIARSLGPSFASRVLNTLILIMGSRDPLSARTDADWCLWGLNVSIGALTGWVTQQYSPDENAMSLLRDACVALTSRVQERTRSRALASLLQQGAFAPSSWNPDSSNTLTVIAYDDIDLSPTPPWFGSELMVVGALLGLSTLAANLAHCGLERQLLQLYHLSRALIISKCPGSHFLAVATVPLCLRLGLIQSGEVFNTFRELSGCVDAAHPEAAIIGLANLVVGVQGMLALPTGYVEDLRSRLLTILAGKETEHGVRVAAMGALYTLIANGGPFFSLFSLGVGAGMLQDKTLSASIVSFGDRLRQTLSGPSQRCRNAASRVLGLLVALKQDDPQVIEIAGTCFIWPAI